jgi:myosin heavy subunit
MQPFQLKLLCRERGLPDTGTSTQLLEALEAHDRGLYAPAPAGGPRPPPAAAGAERARGAAARLPPPTRGRIRLAANFSEAGAEGSQTRRRFERLFIRDLAAKLRVSASRFRIVAVTEGSIIVKFEIAPPEDGAREEPTASEALETLQTQVEERTIGELAGAPVTAFKVVQPTARPARAKRSAVIKFEILPGRLGDTPAEMLEQKLRKELVDGSFKTIATKQIKGFAGVPLDHPLLASPHPPHVAAARARAAFEAASRRRKEVEGKGLHDRRTMNGDLRAITDLVSLRGANAQLIREVLAERSADGVWGTYCCYPEALVSLNPGFNHRDDAAVASYASEFTGSSLRPHAFGIAGAAYRQLMVDHTDHTIVCSGESGSGKTFATRNVLQFLASRDEKSAKTERRLQCSADVLDAFGNARTAHPDSSRYGKYMKLWIDHASGDAVAGALLTTQIERRRVCPHTRDERSFHIFYRMCAGLDRDEARELLHGGVARDFAYLSNYVAIDDDAREDEEGYKKTVASMDGAGISRDEQRKVLGICAAVLAIGNVDFTKGPSNVEFENRHEVDKVSRLLGVDSAPLFKGFAYRTVRTRAETSEVANSVEEAREARDVLAGLVYQQLFQWLADRLNKGLRQSQDLDLETCNTLGILDLYGFEKFVQPQTNGFDQLCVNYADEKVHNLSVAHLALSEQALYAKEKVEFPLRHFADAEFGDFGRLDCVATFEKRRENLVGLLDELCGKSQKDRTVEDSFKAALVDMPFMSRHKPRFSSAENADFTIKHFSGEVDSYTVGYSVEGFATQNRNSLDQDLTEMCASSRDKFVRSLFEPLNQVYMQQRPMQSTMSQYQERLGKIFDEVKSPGMQLHYIKCIRPNLMFTKEFDQDFVQRQIRNMQLPPIIAMRQDVFAHRISFEQIASRYNSMLPVEARAPAGSSALKMCTPILSTLVEDEQSRYQIGKNVLFMTDACYRQLEGKLTTRLDGHIMRVQAIGRMWRQRKAYRRKLGQRFQDMLSEHLASDDLREIQHAVKKLETIPEMQDSRNQLVDRLDTLLEEMVKELSLLSGKAERMAEYLHELKRVGPAERQGKSQGQEKDAPPPAPKSFLSQVGDTFAKMDTNLDDLLYGSSDDDDDEVAGQVPQKDRSQKEDSVGTSASTATSTGWSPKHVSPSPLPAPYAECTIEDICALSTQMKDCIARYDKNKTFAAEQFERINIARGEMINKVKEYIRKYRDCEDPEAFLRRVEDFNPIRSELVELAALESELEELVTRDRAHMRAMVRNTDPLEVHEVLQRSQGIPGVQSEWDLLNSHFEGLRRVAMEELQGLLYESQPARIYADLRKFDIFGEDAKVLCVKVKAHRSALIRAAQQRLTDVMAAGGGPSAVRDVLDLFKDYPEDLDPARESVLAYLDNRVTALAKRSDQLLLTESIEDIDEFLVRTPDQDFGDALRHKLEALHSRKKELIQALQLEIKSAARSTDIGKVSRALDASEPYLAYVGTERKELVARFGMLVKDTKAHMLSLLQGEDYTAVLTMLEASEAFPPELASDVAALKLHRGTLLQQVKQRMKEVLATEDPVEIMQELGSVAAYGDDVIDETIALQQRRDIVVQQAKAVILTLLQNKDATIRGVLKTIHQYATYPDLDSERDSLSRKLDVLVDSAERTLADLVHSSDAYAIDRALKDLEETDERLNPAIKSLLRHRKDLSRNVSLKMHSMLHSEDPSTIDEVLKEAVAFGEDLASERTSLQAHKAAVLDRANREMEDLQLTKDYEKVADALKLYERFPEETKIAYKELEQVRELLLANARTAIADMSKNHPNDLQMASDAMFKYEAYPQHIRSMVAQWFQKLIGHAQIDILALVQSDQFVTVDRALERYKRVGAEDLKQDIANLGRHRDSLLERVRKRLQMLSVSCEDPQEITHELHHHEEFGQHVGEEIKMLNERRAKLIQMAQDELTKLVQSPDITLRELEAAIKKYRDYPLEVQLVYNAMKKKYEAFVRQAEDRLTSLLTSFNVKNIDQALSELRNACDALAPLLEKLEKHRLEACLAMSTKMQAAARGTDALVVNQILEDAKDFGKDLQVERDALQDRYEWLLGDAKAEITEMLKSNNFSAIMKCIEKYERYPASMDHMRDKLERHKETLLSDTRLRFSELCVSDDPQEIVIQLSLTEAFAEHVHEERKAVQSRLADLLRQARAQMRNMVQDPDATLGEIEKCLSRYGDYPDDVQQARALLTNKRDAMADSASELLAGLQHSDDILAINDGLSKYAGSSDLVRSAVTLVENHRDGLCRAVAKRMRAAAASEDLVAMHDLLASWEPYTSDEVRREQQALTLRYQSVTDLIITEIRELCKSKDFERVDLACEKFKTYPESIRPRWQELMGHRKALLEQARRELEKARKGSDPKQISETIAACEKFGKAIAPERVALQARWSELVHNAHKDMLSLVQNKQATVDLIELKLAQYADYPRDVDEVRRKLRDKAESLQQIKQELAVLCETEDPDEILKALKDFMRYGAAVSAEMESLQAQFRHLMRTARTTMRSAVQDPGAQIPQMEKMLSNYSGYPDDVAAVRNALQKKVANSKAVARERVMRLMSSGKIPEIDAAIRELADANEHLDNIVDDLEKHRDELCLSFAAKMEEALLSSDLNAVSELLMESEPLGEDLRQLREAVTRHYNRLLERICARLQALCQSDDYALINETLEEHADDVADIRADWEALQRHRDSLLEKSKANLKAQRASEDPNQIDAALESVEGGGDDVAEEIAELRNRRQMLIDDARKTMERLVESDDATITDVGVHLQKFRYFPEDVFEIRDQLAQKHESLLEAAKKDLAELARSNDIERIDSCIREVQDQHPSVVAGLRELQRHRNELVRSMSVKVQTAAGYDEPGMIITVLEESQSYEEDLHSERGALKDHYSNVIHSANEELHAALQLEHYDTVAAVLAKYENYPGEVKQRWQTLHAHLSSLRQDTLFHVQQALTSRDSKEIDALLAKVETFGADMHKYRDMLLLRRSKLLDTARQSIRQALTSTDLEVIDRTFDENAHLVSEFPKEYFSALRKHREDVVEEVRSSIRQAVNGFSLVEVEKQLERTAGFEDELFEEIQELQEHRSYVLEEADAVKQSGRNILTSMEFSSVDAKLTQLETFGSHCQDEVSALRAHRKWLIDMAKSDMRNCASSTDPQLIAATLMKYEHLGETVQEEAAALAACVTQLQEQHRTWLLDTLSEPNPAKSKEVLDSTEYFAEELSNERIRLIKHRNSTIDHARNEMSKELCGNSIGRIQVALREFRDFGDEVQELYDALESHLHQLCEVAKQRLHSVGNSGDLEMMALTLDEYRNLASEQLDQAYHALELSYTREATNKKHELRELLAAEDISFLRARLMATPASNAYLEELSAIESRITVLVEDGRLQMNQLMNSDDRLAIQSVLRRYEGEELELSEEMAILRERLAALEQGRRFYVPSRSQRDASLARAAAPSAALHPLSPRAQGQQQARGGAGSPRSQQPRDHRSATRAVQAGRVVGSPTPAAHFVTQMPQPEPEPEPEQAYGVSSPSVAGALALPPQRPAPQPDVGRQRTDSSRHRRTGSDSGDSASSRRSRRGQRATSAPPRWTEADIERAIMELCQMRFDESSKQRYRSDFNQAALQKFSVLYDHVSAASAAGETTSCIVCGGQVQPHECEGHVGSCRDALIKFAYKKCRQQSK